ncbi:hypothetical protein CLCR_00551 [Cladophialophora carrionii]|uniref:Uncharacterized protein n=1 Tax=Cladophialophora carrionii TaxID=86049 RepID=A0A1C1C6V3_9EURO|nr:hypothetical protein CLCR_00551 [Cladophialophora carrionii]
MPSSWLEDDESEAWCAEADANAGGTDEAQRRQSSDSADVNVYVKVSAAPQQQQQHHPADTGQDEHQPSYAGVYAPDTGLHAATLNSSPLKPASASPAADISGGHLHEVLQEYSSEAEAEADVADEGEGEDEASVSVSVSVSTSGFGFGFGSGSGPGPGPSCIHRLDRHTRPSDKDSLFGDSASEATVEEVSWGKARSQSGNETAHTTVVPSAQPSIPRRPDVDVNMNTRPPSCSSPNTAPESSSPSTSAHFVSEDIGAGAGAAARATVSPPANPESLGEHGHHRSSTLLANLFAEQGWPEHDPAHPASGNGNLGWDEGQLLLANQRREARWEFQPDPAVGFEEVLGRAVVGGGNEGKGKDRGEPGALKKSKDSVGTGSGNTSLHEDEDCGGDDDGDGDGIGGGHRGEDGGDGGGGGDDDHNMDRSGHERESGRESPPDTQDSVHHVDYAEEAYHCVADDGDEKKEDDQEQGYCDDERHHEHDHEHDHDHDHDHDHHNHHDYNHDDPHDETQYQHESGRGGQHQDQNQNQTSSDDEDDPWPPPRPETIDILADSAPWSHLRDRYNPEEDDVYWKPARSPETKPKLQGFAQYATQSKPTWAPPLRPLSEDEKEYARVLYYERLKREGRGPYARDKRGPAQEGEAEQLCYADPDERREMIEETAWRAREIKRRRREVFSGEHFGKGGPHDSNLWSEEQRLYMMSTIDLEVETLVEERRAKQRREKEAEEKKMHEGEKAEGKWKDTDTDTDTNNAEGSAGERDAGSCGCPCGGETSKCSCHPLYCPCSGCDHAEQAEQLRKEAEMKWGEGEGEGEGKGDDDNAQAPTETAKQHGACCGGSTTQERCVCLPGLCSCAGCEEHHVGHGQPGMELEVEVEMEPPSTHSGLWPRIPESERLFKLEQKRVPDEDRDCACSANGVCHCPSGRCKCRKPLSAPEQWVQPREELAPLTFPRTAATWTSGQYNHPLDVGLTQDEGAQTLPDAPPSITGGFLHPTATATSTQAAVATSRRQSPIPPSRPDTPRPPADSGASTPYAADVLHEYARHSVEPEPMPPSQTDVRQSVEPEYPPPDWTRDTTPAYEDRSFTPSPFSNRGDVDMRDASGGTIVPSALGRDAPVSAPDLDPEEHRSPSPKRPHPPPIPESLIKQPKRDDRRKSAVQGSKVEKRSTTGTKTKPRSRNVTRKPTQSVGKLVEQVKKGSQDAGQAEGSFESEEPIKPAPKPGGKVAEAVRNIERQLQQQEKHLKQKNGSPVRRSARANKGVRTSSGYGSPK